MKNNKRKTTIASLIKRFKDKRRYKGVKRTGIAMYSRKLARSMAKAKMKKAGVKHVNSCMRYANWPEWAVR